MAGSSLPHCWTAYKRGPEVAAETENAISLEDVRLGHLFYCNDRCRFFLYQDAFTSTFRDVVLGTKTIGRVQLLRRSPTFIQVYF